MSSQFRYFHVIYSLKLRIEIHFQIQAKVIHRLYIVIAVDQGR